jgi:uncharacterized damage-inducible protein DinB
MDPRVIGLAEILKLNTRLFRNCLDGFTAEAAAERLSPRTNSAAFVAAHVADSRYQLLQALGVATPSPLERDLKDAKGIDDLARCPTLDESREAWSAASHALRDRLQAMTAADLDAPVTFPGASSVLEVLAFFVQHDSHHVGQLALLRKHAGLPAMSYK